jgi:hypothetical protein
VEVFLF